MKKNTKFGEDTYSIRKGVRRVVPVKVGIEGVHRRRGVMHHQVGNVRHHDVGLMRQSICYKK